MTNTDTIKKIQELCPDVLSETICIRCGENKGYPFPCKERGKTYAQHIPKEILGKPITLAVVLRAILKVNPANRTNIVVESSGDFIQTVYNGSFSEKILVANWNLLKDNFNDQSEETKTFIGKLLK